MTCENLEVLSVLLALSCLALFYLWSQSTSHKSEGMHNHIPGLKFKDGFSDYASDVTQVGYNRSLKPLEGMQDGPPGLKFEGLTNDLEPTPSMHGLENQTGIRGGSTVGPKSPEGDIQWACDATIPLDVFTRDGCIENQSNDESDDVTKAIFTRQVNRVKSAAPSRSGTVLTMTDYSAPSRNLTC